MYIQNLHARSFKLKYNLSKYLKLNHQILIQNHVIFTLVWNEGNKKNERLYQCQLNVRQSYWTTLLSNHAVYGYKTIIMVHSC